MARNINYEGISQLALASTMLDLRPIIATTMRYCGASLEEIGIAFGMSKQGVKQLLDKYEQEVLNGN